MSRLFICDTPFQVMASLLLSWSHSDSSADDYIVTDNMPGAEDAARRLSCLDSVRDARVAHVKHVHASSFEKKAGYLLDLILPYELRWSEVFCGEAYEDLYVRNYADPFSVSAYSHFLRANSAVSLHVYDEGYSNYSRRFWQPDKRFSFLHSAAERIARMLGKRFPAENIGTVHLFDPDMLRFELPFPVEKLAVERFSLDESKLNDLNKAFGFRKNSDAVLDFVNDDSIVGTKYLFFEESFAEDSGNEDDLGVLNEISEIVGMNNILVKLHPRSTRDRFSPLGYRVVESAGYPWEVVALNVPRDSDVVLVSYSSGSLLNYHFLCDARMRSVLLFDLFPGVCHALDDDEKRFFRDFQMRYSESVSIPSSKGQLLEALGV